MLLFSSQISVIFFVRVILRSQCLEIHKFCIARINCRGRIKRAIGSWVRVRNFFALESTQVEANEFGFYLVFAEHLYWWPLGSLLESLKLVSKSLDRRIVRFCVLHPSNGELISETRDQTYTVYCIIRATVGRIAWLRGVWGRHCVDILVLAEQRKHGPTFTRFYIEDHLVVHRMWLHEVYSLLELVSINRVVSSWHLNNARSSVVREEHKHLWIWIWT